MRYLLFFLYNRKKNVYNANTTHLVATQPVIIKMKSCLGLTTLARRNPVNLSARKDEAEVTVECVNSCTKYVVQSDS